MNDDQNVSAPPFRVRTSGLISNSPYHSTPGTKGGDVMLTVFLSGQGYYENSEGKRSVTGGMIGLVTPGDAGILASDTACPYTHYYCRFNGHYAVSMAADILKRQADCFFPHNFAYDVSHYLKQMGQFSSRDLPDEMGWREAYLVQALVTLTGSVQAPQESGLSAHTLDEYLDAHIAEPTDLARIGEYFGVSKTTLCRKAKRWFGASVQKLHERKKMARAEDLLTFTRCSTAEVARRTGYYDPLYFSRVFRRYNGVSPRSFKQNQRQ